jgi:aminopeptidase N
MNPHVHAIAPTPVLLRDYAPPAWRVERVELVFDLAIDVTLVHARVLLCVGADASAPLHLDGEQLELLALRLDGRELGAADYSLDVHALRVPGVCDGSVLEYTVRLAPQPTPRCRACI